MRPIRTFAILPTMFTLGNLVCGFFAIVIASRVHTPTSPEGNLATDPSDCMYSAWLIFLGMVFDALDRLMEGKTCIIVAHRLATIRRADAIYVVENGAIVESGTHDDLLKSGGLYSELYGIQFQTEASLEPTQAI